MKITDSRTLDAIQRACENTEGHGDRWDETSPTINDADLTARLAYEFGIYGGSGGGNEYDVEYSGGSKPWLKVTDNDGIETKLWGTGLLEVVRDIYGLRPRATITQLQLF